MPMYFKDLKPNYSVYMFDKHDISITQGKVINVSVPHFDKTVYDVNSNMVVDVMLLFNDVTKTYTFKSETDTGYVDTKIITTEKLNIVREVEIIKTLSEEILSQVDVHKNNVEKCTEILAEFNPAIKDKKEIDERFGKLEGSINELKSMLSNIVSR